MPSSPDRGLVIAPWRQATAAEVARLYAEEQRRFAAVLDWDVAATWAVLEPARVAGSLPGLIARPADGAIAGWTYFVARGDELQVGGLTASRDAVRPLLEALDVEAGHAGCPRLRIFGYADAPGLAEALTSRGFAVGAYHYLTAALPGRPIDGGAATMWSPHDLGGAAELLRAAYRDADALRPFGGDGRIDDWIDYVVGLTSTPGCGAFAPELTLVARRSTETRALDALAMVTRLAPQTVHLAQLAVAPAARGRGLATTMLTAAMQRAATQGATRMSLLVAADNAVARRLYAARGFRHVASFVSASGPAAAGMRRQPRRSSSAA